VRYATLLLLDVDAGFDPDDPDDPEPDEPEPDEPEPDESEDLAAGFAEAESFDDEPPLSDDEPPEPPESPEPFEPLEESDESEDLPASLELLLDDEERLSVL
jgi:hypothetical protein